jgi:chromosome segregation ATPase
MEQSGNHKDFKSLTRHDLSNSDDVETDQLKSEIDYLRAQLDFLSKKNLQSLIELKQHQEQQLSQLLHAKDSELKKEFSGILSLQKVLGEESDKCSHLRQLILNTKLEHGEKFSEMNSDLERLVKEAEYLRYESIKSCKDEVQEYQGKLESKRLQLNRTLRDSEKEKHEELYRLQSILDEDNNKIQILEYEIQGLKSKINEKNQYNEGELDKIHATLRSTQRMLEQQERDLETLRIDREKARKEARDTEKNMNVVRHKVNSLKSENEELKGQLKRLEKITYGN